MARAGRRIHARAPWVAHPEAYTAPQQPQQPAGAPVRSVPRTAPQRPADARTLEDAIAGIMRAAGGPPPSLQHPAMGKGAFVILGGHGQRVPEGVAISAGRAGDRDVAYLMNSAGRIQILIATAAGIRELINVPPQLLTRIRRERFGR